MIKTPNLSNYWQMFLKTVWDKCSVDVGNTLIHLGALGWFLSAAAQVHMIFRNKDIDAKQKEFLLPQETMDMFVNVGLYYTICQTIKKTCDGIIENGHFVTQKTFDTVSKMKQNLPSSSITDYLKSMDEAYLATERVKPTNLPQRLTNLYEGTYSVLEEMLQAKQGSSANASAAAESIKQLFESQPILKETFTDVFESKNLKNVQDEIGKTMGEYKMFKNGVGVFSAVFASVLACNIITPIARNYTANYFQKKAIKHDEKKKFRIINEFNRRIPMPHTYSSFKI